MDDAPRISDAEWQVMEALWERHPATAQEVAARVGPANDWSEPTVKTMLARLVKKAALTFLRDGKRYLYAPAVDRDACVRSATRSLAERLFGGRESPMLQMLLRDAPLSPAEIDALERLLEEKRRGRKR